jgi:hypothetical protein
MAGEHKQETLLEEVEDKAEEGSKDPGTDTPDQDPVSRFSSMSSTDDWRLP